MVREDIEKQEIFYQDGTEEFRLYYHKPDPQLLTFMILGKCEPGKFPVTNMLSFIGKVLGIIGGCNES